MTNLTKAAKMNLIWEAFEMLGIAPVMYVDYKNKYGNQDALLIAVGNMLDGTESTNL